MTLSSIQRSLLALGRRAKQGSTARGWESTVRRAIRELENLNRSTERDFLAVGEKLMEFRSAARQISSDMLTVTELISGQQGRNASHALTQMLDHSREIDARIQHSGQALEDVRELSRRIRHALSGLPHTVSVFRTLCTLTRIETARLGGTGADLGHLTSEVGPLSESIQTSGEGILEAARGLDRDVQSAIRSGTDLQATQLRELPALIAGVMDGLKLFEERQKCAMESSDRQAAQYAAVREAVDDLVGSIQFHDITRQQIEHVIEALQRLCSEGESRGGSLDSPAGDAGMVLTLQSRHLSEAAAIFAASIERMERDLAGIAARIESTPEASRALLGISGGDISGDEQHQDSFFEKMEGQFSALLSMLGTCAGAQTQMESTASRLEETIRNMRDSIGEIRGIEIRIQRISTNASVWATHLGAGGIALNVIAEVMQRLALDSNTKTEEVAGTLDTMSEAAGRVSGRAGNAAPGAQSITSQVVEEMRRTIGELHSSSESSFSRVNDIVALGARLAGDIGAVRDGFSAGKIFAEAVHRVRGELEEIGARHWQAAQVSTEGDPAARAQALENYAGNYTMQRERDVHYAVTTGSALLASPTEAQKGPTEEGDLGGNVELF
jgi:methyl-accepting chemotaxis protein